MNELARMSEEEYLYWENQGQEEKGINQAVKLEEENKMTTKNNWKLEEYNGWDNYYTWATNLWITSNSESDYLYFTELALDMKLENFKNVVVGFINSGQVKDFDEEDIREAIEHVDYKRLYEGLRE